MSPARAGLITVVLALAAALPAQAAGGGALGSPGLGDPFFPLAGNGGYDVGHYGLTLDYDPRDRRARRRRRSIRARATQTLDALRPRPARLRRHPAARSTAARPPTGAPARSSSSRRARALRRGRRFTVLVRYAGVPEVITDPDDSIEGWVPTADGAFVVGEPQGAPGWFPANDNPQDKATFDIAITVPDGLTALGNGVLAGALRTAGARPGVWHESDPMATYLATATNGRFDADARRASTAIPVYNAVDPTLARGRSARCWTSARRSCASSARCTGRTRSTRPARSSTTRPTSATRWRPRPSRSSTACPTRRPLVHELAHQWFGDAVTLRQWPDIWLHEGFATWSEWIWSRAPRRPDGARSASTTCTRRRASDAALWDPPPGRVPGGRRPVQRLRSTTAAR